MPGADPHRTTWTDDFGPRDVLVEYARVDPAGEAALLTMKSDLLHGPSRESATTTARAARRSGYPVACAVARVANTTNHVRRIFTATRT